ncbi:hypothetical protein TrVE_jg1786 [Triparma verrucosa]|uniref:Vacuolar protein sorting-associated protein 13 VPS13 adaptor binding domain-containing protein n=1 Tax=Triparma verrucosa TaxID=1606542 RepID=A0A9W7FGT7_9STRA|nr:hypothetical protein TrVE_jg1786 [Triparma verrucosa]
MLSYQNDKSPSSPLSSTTKKILAVYNGELTLKHNTSTEELIGKMSPMVKININDDGVKVEVEIAKVKAGVGRCLIREISYLKTLTSRSSLHYVILRHRPETFYAKAYWLYAYKAVILTLPPLKKNNFKYILENRKEYWRLLRNGEGKNERVKEIEERLEVEEVAFLRSQIQKNADPLNSLTLPSGSKTFNFHVNLHKISLHLPSTPSLEILTSLSYTFNSSPNLTASSLHISSIKIITDTGLNILTPSTSSPTIKLSQNKSPTKTHTKINVSPYTFTALPISFPFTTFLPLPTPSSLKKFVESRRKILENDMYTFEGRIENPRIVVQGEGRRGEVDLGVLEIKNGGGEWEVGLERFRVFSKDIGNEVEDDIVEDFSIKLKVKVKREEGRRKIEVEGGMKGLDVFVRRKDWNLLKVMKFGTTKKENFESYPPPSDDPPPPTPPNPKLPNIVSVDFKSESMNLTVINDVEGSNNHRQYLENVKNEPCEILRSEIKGLHIKSLVESGGPSNSKKTLLIKLNKITVLDPLSPNPNFKSLLSGGLQSSDLITYDQTSTSTSTDTSIKITDINCNWNPECMSRIFYCLRPPPSFPSPGPSPKNDEESSDDDFFDAEDGDYEDETRGSIYEDVEEEGGMRFFSPIANRLSNPNRTYSLTNSLNPVDLNPTTQPPPKKINLTLTLNSLSITFNKDSRSRPLMTLKISTLNLRHLKNPRSLGGHLTTCKFHDLKLIDSSGLYGNLYTDVVGVKLGKEEESDVVISFEAFERAEDRFDGRGEGAMIDEETGNVENYDTVFKIKFRNVRVVYQQQLWLEIVDYFFLGILGDEVWGNFNKEEEDRVFLENLSKRLNDPDAEPEVWAENVRFLKFEITIEEPQLVLPAHYRSMSFLSLDIDQVRVSNYFSNLDELDPLTTTPTYRKQFYNNCTVLAPSISITSVTASSKNTLTTSPVSLTCSINWPLGDVVSRVVPRWKITLVLDSITSLIRRDDYKVLRDIIYDNIMEETRNMSEWIELLNKREDDEDYIDRDAFVLYGYDIKNGTPTTYDFTVNVNKFNVLFVDNEGGANCEVRGDFFVWSYSKDKDMRTCMKVESGGICLRQKSGNKELGGFEDLIEPIENDEATLDKANDDRKINDINDLIDLNQNTPQLLYTSNSKPDGSNVKTLFIYEARIYMVLEAWRGVKNFFTGLPPTDILTVEQAKSVVTINHDFFRTNPNMTPVVPPPCETPPPTKFTPFQFRLVLINAKIILPSDFSITAGPDVQGVSLKCDCDFLYTKLDNEGGQETDLFVNDLELFTGPAKSKTRLKEKSSLLEPLSFRLKKFKQGHRSSLVVDCEVVRARAKYTDMSLAVDVGLQLMSDLKSDGNEQQQDEEMSNEPPAPSYDKSEVKMNCSGVSLLVVDNSERHFSGSQELVKLELGGLEYVNSSNKSDDSENTKLTLRKIEMIDYLQPMESPFRLAACSYENLFEEGMEEETGDGDEGRLRWEDVVVQKDPEWGYGAVSPISLIEAAPTPSNLITLTKTSTSDSNNIDLKCQEIAFQWNPNTVIALQRFLGRLKKEATGKIGGKENELNLKRSKSFNQLPPGSPAISPSPSATALSDAGGNVDVKRTVASITLSSLSVCLNKEHEGRRLLRCGLSSIVLNLRDEGLKGKSVSAVIGGFVATDPSANLLDENREVVKQEGKEGELIVIEYFRISGEGGEDVAKAAKAGYVDHIRSLGKPNFNASSFDSFMKIAVKPISVNLVAGRTLELADYLSNGLPGKGMGVVGGKAKGFLKEKAKTRSSLCVEVAPPTIVIPRNKGSGEKTKWKMGSIGVISWHEEEKGGHYRQLEVVISGVGGGNMVEVPVDLNVRISQQKDVELAPIRVLVVVTPIEVKMRYTDWLLFRSILKENISDIPKFSNLEREYAGLVEGARVVRYGGGKEGKSEGVGEQTGKLASPIDATLDLSTFAVTLVRNDDVAASNPYELTRVELKNVKVKFGSEVDGGRSGEVSCGSFKLLDLGDEVRRRLKGDGTAAAAFHDIIKGYKGGGGESGDEIVLSYDYSLGSDAVVSIGIYHLSIFGLVRPIVDLLDFCRGTWTAGGEGGGSGEAGDEQVEEEGGAAKEERKKVKGKIPKLGGTRIKLVAHKPQFHLLVDETDEKSKALVLRGLAEVDVVIANEKGAANDARDVRGVTSGVVKIDSLESFITEDVLAKGGKVSDGVALLEPLFGEMSISVMTRPLHPTVQVINLNMQPLGTSISYSDFDMIKKVTKRWEKERNDARRLLGGAAVSAKKTKVTEAPALFKGVMPFDTGSIASGSGVESAAGGGAEVFYDVEFRTSKLGLILRKRGRLIVVEDVKKAEYSSLVEVGSWLHSIDGHTVRRVPFETVVKMLQELPRPMRVTFGKVVRDTDGGAKVIEDESSPTLSTKFYSLPTGLSLRPSPHGAAVVASLSPAFEISTSLGFGLGEGSVELQLAAQQASKVRKPRVGAMIVEVNGVCVLGRAFDDVLNVCEGGEESGEGGNAPVLTIKFSEIPSSVMPPKTTFTLSLSSIHTTVINDIGVSGEIPTLRMGISKVGLKVDRAVVFKPALGAMIDRGDEIALKEGLLKNKIMGVTLEGCLNVDYYNLGVVTWEPAVEPSFFAVGYLNSKVGGKESKEVGVEVEHLKLNASDACLGVVGVLLAARREDEEGGEEMKIKSMKKTALTAGIAAKLARQNDNGGYKIRNRTGYDIFVLEEGGTKEGVKVERGGEAEFDLEKEKAGGRGDVKNMNVGLKFGGGLGMDIFGLPVTRVGKIVRELGAGGVSLQWDVKLSKNLRVVTVSGNAKVLGGGDFEVGVVRGWTNEIESLGKCEEDGGVPLPIQITSLDVRLKYVGWEGYDWCKKSIMDGGPVCCEHTGGEESKIRYLCSPFRTDDSLDISVTSTLTLTNNLPVKLDFEVADGPAAGANVNIIGTGTALEVGEVSNVLACDMENTMPTIRVKVGGVGWSNWCVLRVSEEAERKDGKKKTDISRARELVCQADDGSGNLVTFGVRVRKKVVNGVALDAYDVVIFASLWIHNLSGLDLTIGAPTTQIFPPNHVLLESSNANMKVEVAEALLNEITGVFQPGNTKLDDNQVDWDFVPLPGQKCNVLWEEIWEYEEEGRKWTAGENWRNARLPRKNWRAPVGWEWEGNWKVCAAGSVSPQGYESCRSLHGGLVGGFSSRRTFSEDHSVRRRRLVRQRKRSGGTGTEGNMLFHEPLKQEQLKREGLLDRVGRSDGDSAVTLGLKLLDSCWSPVSLGGGSENQVLTMPVGRYSAESLRGSPGASTKGHDLSIFSETNEWGDRVVYIDNALVIINEGKVALMVRQRETAEEFVVQAGDELPFSWADIQRPKVIEVKLGECGEWSGGVAPTVGLLPVRVRGEGGGTLRACGIVRNGRGLTLSLSLEDVSDALVKFDNQTQFPVWIRQELEGAVRVDKLETGISAIGWDEPLADGGVFALNLGAFGVDETTTKFVTLEVGASVRLSPHKIPGLDVPELQGLRILVYVQGEGVRRTLTAVLIKKNVTVGSEVGSLFRRQTQIVFGDSQNIGQDVCNAIEDSLLKLRKGKLLSENDTIDALKRAAKRKDLGEGVLQLTLSVGVLSLSVIDSVPSEICLATLKNLRAALRMDGGDAILNAKVGFLQLDNYCPGSPFPVAVYSDNDVDTGDAIDVIIVMGGRSQGINVIKVIDVTFCKGFSLNLDLVFLVRLQLFYKLLKAKLGREGIGAADLAAKWSAQEWGERGTKGGKNESPVYFEAVTIRNCTISLSVETSRELTEVERRGEGDFASIHDGILKGDLNLAEGGINVIVGGHNRTAGAAVSGMLRNILFDALLRIQGAQISLDPVVLRHHLGSSSSSLLGDVLAPVYFNSLRASLLNVLGSMAAFGNPLAVVTGVTRGFGEFVDTTTKGFRESAMSLDPTHAAMGVIHGTTSLGQNIVGGIAQSASSITSTIGNNLAAATFDSNWKKKRGGDIEEDPTNLLEGIGRGGEKVLDGLLDGFSGAIMLPMRGAERHGLKGFGTGLLKGGLSLVLKPVIGLADGATDVIRGVQSGMEGGGSNNDLGGGDGRQMRIRRALYGDGKILKAYSRNDAAGFQLISATPRLNNESFLAAFDFTSAVVLCGSASIVILGQDGEERTYFPYTEVQSCEVAKESVEYEGGSTLKFVVKIVLTSREVQLDGESEYSASALVVFLNDKGGEM